MKNLSSICGAGWLAVSLCVSSCLQAADAPAGTLPASCAPLLDAAARSLANGDLVAARSGFNSVLDDVAAPPFVRGLAFTGLAETALASNDRTTALDWWKRQMADPTLTAFQRELAGQRLVGSDREVTGIPVRSPAEFRASLPSLPLPALTFFVAPDGAETNDGSRTHPFATLAQARDAIRRLKQAGGGDLPVGGVQVILVAGDYPVRETFTLGAEDSGSAVAPVVYRATPGATVRLQGLQNHQLEAHSRFGGESAALPWCRGCRSRSGSQAIGPAGLGGPHRVARAPGVVRRWRPSNVGALAERGLC